jgi:dihydrofolate reductase
MTLSIIVSIGKNMELGKNDALVWRLPDDLRFFKQTTQGHTVIMGRKTYESIGRLLPNRRNIIVTRNPSFQVDGAFIAHSFDDALAVAAGDGEVFVIGGASIIAEALPQTDRLYLTHIDATDADADTYFPPIDFSAWKKIEEAKHNTDEKHPVAFTMTTYERR